MSRYVEIPTDQIEHFENDTAPALPKVAPVVRSATMLNGRDLNSVVNGAGERHQIDPDFINSMISAGSGLPKNAVSKKVAQGDIEGITKYFRELLEKYNYDAPKALAAYYAGPDLVEQYHGVPPDYDTRAYVARVIRDFNRKKLEQNPALAKERQTATPQGTSDSNAYRLTLSDVDQQHKTNTRPNSPSMYKTALEYCKTAPGTSSFCYDHGFNAVVGKVVQDEKGIRHYCPGAGKRCEPMVDDDPIKADEECFRSGVCKEATGLIKSDQ